MLIQSHKTLWLGIAALLFIAGCTDDKPDFNAEVRPILNKSCISCHGGVKKAGGFSLLFEHEAIAVTKSGKPAIIPGDADGSEMIKRLTHHDEELRMPLEAPPLSEKEIDILKRWVNSGAKWEEHWAYIPPEKPEVPAVQEEAWCATPIDNFIAKAWEEKGLVHGAEGEKGTLLRRVYLDIIGLPPSPQQLENFEQDERDEAYEEVVDSLLASPHFGEKWASMWLDLARYADSRGYERDRHRDMFAYRDWVIKAFNEDMPFDQFSIEQLAGDLLPNPTKSQKLATGFHRNTMNNDEGGTDNEEFRVAAVMDRTTTTWEVWQATSMGCVQCHSHPYDPIVMEDYYKTYAFFNQSLDADLHSDFPLEQVYTIEQEQKIDSLVQFIAKLQNKPVKTNFDDESYRLKLSYPRLEAEYSLVQNRTGTHHGRLICHDTSSFMMPAVDLTGKKSLTARYLCYTYGACALT